MNNALYVICGIGDLFLVAGALIGIPGTLIFLMKGGFSRDGAVRAACFGAAKGSSLGFLALLLLSPFISAIGMGFQANTTFDSAMSFFSLTLLPLIVTVTLMVRGFYNAE